MRYAMLAVSCAVVFAATPAWASPALTFTTSGAEVVAGDWLTIRLSLPEAVPYACDFYLGYVDPPGKIVSAVPARGGVQFSKGLRKYGSFPGGIGAPASLTLVDGTVGDISRGEYRFIALLAPCRGGKEIRADLAIEVGYLKEMNIPVPMRDGVILRANLMRPAPWGRHPVLIFRTPYSKDEGDPDNERTFRHAVDRGYAMVIQDVRGRYMSDGDYTPYMNEGRDGYDTIEWAAIQPWSDGNVGTLGLSYPGAVQWLAAVESPPHLKAMVPAMCFSTIRQCVYFSGVFETAWSSWVYVDMTPDTRVRYGIPGPTTVDEAKEEYNHIGVDTFQGWLPQLTLPYLMDTAQYYYDWLRHQPYESYWDWGNLEDKYDRVQAAVLNISGWYDEAYGTQGATTNYLGLLSVRAGQKDPRTKLLIGPWIHGVDATSSTSSGDREFSPAAVIDYDDVVLSWLDHYVRGINNWVVKAKPVNVFVMGDNRWRHENRWPLASSRSTAVYLA
ncbi:MAG: CocE/NonD family hydrolase, partial [Candidatus Aureabacteria bacterium]|nr:CocE/NonD family hydrolase [Candidatus Auribacterota bacterium]